MKFQWFRPSVVFKMTVDMITIWLSLLALKFVVIMTTTGAVSDEKVGIVIYRALGKILHHKQLNSKKFYSIFKYFHLRKHIWKCPRVSAKAHWVNSWFTWYIFHAQYLTNPISHIRVLYSMAFLYVLHILYEWDSLGMWFISHINVIPYHMDISESCPYQHTIWRVFPLTYVHGFALACFALVYWLLFQHFFLFFSGLFHWRWDYMQGSNQGGYWSNWPISHENTTMHKQHL